MNGLASASRRRRQNVKENDKEDGEETEVEVVEMGEKWWWEAPLDGLSVEPLKESYTSLQELLKNICSHVKERMANANPGFGGNLVAPPSPPQGSNSSACRGVDTNSHSVNNVA